MTNTARQLLWVLRAVWGVFLAEVLVNALVFFLIVDDSNRLVFDDANGWTFFIFAAPIFCLVSAGLYFFRNQVYKRYWRGDRVATPAYLISNAVLIGWFYLAALAALVVAVFIGAMLANLALYALAVVGHAVNFPTGKPLLPASPRTEAAV